MIEIEESSGNVYEDLSAPNANEMRVKSQTGRKNWRNHKGSPFDSGSSV